jgi:hypothetical protein
VYLNLSSELLKGINMEKNSNNLKVAELETVVAPSNAIDSPLNAAVAYRVIVGIFLAN